MSRPIALHLSGLRQVLHDPESGDSFAVLVEQPIDVPQGTFVGILGDSGCGKTTLLTVLGLLRGRTPQSELTAFQMRFRGGDAPTDLLPYWSGPQRRRAHRLRRRHFGFALQHGELLPALTVAENIMLPMRLNGIGPRASRVRAAQIIDAFQLYRPRGDGSRDSLAGTRLARLSGGQFQRVALARALAHRPDFVFVDEPTANLNREVARHALRQLADLRTNEADPATVFMITHDETLANEFCDLLIRMRPVPRDSAEGPPQGHVWQIENRTPKS